MFINTVNSLEDSFTGFKRVVYAYVWANVKEHVYTATGEIDKFIFRQLTIIGEDEFDIKAKADKELRDAYPEGDFVITNIIPYKETLTRELRKEFRDVLEEIHSPQPL